MTHTDLDGFIYFLRGDDWTDSDWVRDIYDMEIDVEGCTPSSLTFDPENPWTLHEARAIAKFGSELLAKPNFYYHTSLPKVIELDNGGALLAIYNNNVIEWYGVLDTEGLKALARNVNRYNVMILITQ